MTGMTAEPVEVVTLGECMASFVALEPGPMAEATRYLRTIAGAEANVAVGLARLGHRVAFVGRVGRDGLGSAILRHLRGEGVDIGGIREDPAAPTGVMIRELRDLGAAEVAYWRAGSAGSRLSASDVDEADGAFAAARWLHVTGITPALSGSAAAAIETALDRAALGGLTISLDVNIRRRLWTEDRARPALAALAARASVILGGLDELAVIAGVAATLEDGARSEPAEVASGILALGAEHVVVKLGPAGALEVSHDTDARVTRAEGLSVPIVRDPVGAGDAFCAGYIAARLEGRESREALRWGNACGAAAVATVGDQLGLPTRAELERLLSDGGPDTLR